MRQVIGWREYMRATYDLYGRRLRTRNLLGHAAPLDAGLVDRRDRASTRSTTWCARVLERGYAHHIERLMVLGNAMCLLRTDPDAVYEWFMEMFVDAYDWVMVPNVYAMSQFAAGPAITTKPYVSGSNYLRKMSDFARGLGDWRDDWDALYWTFVRDHHDVFAAQPPLADDRERSTTGMDPATKAAHTRRAAGWLSLMPKLHALELLPDAAGEAAVRRDWQALRDAGLPSMLDHTGATNTPHVTVIAVPAIAADDEALAVELLAPLLPVAGAACRAGVLRR